VSLLEELRVDSRPSGNHCSACVFIADQPNPDEWHEAMGDRTITHRALFRAMKARGYWCKSYKPVEEHRRAEHVSEG
jgi:hypothetical protein